MSLEETFRELSASLHRLHDALHALHLTVGDQPPDDEAAVADALENAVLDILGALHETSRCALQARKAVAHPPNLDRARYALALCQKRFQGIEQQFASDLVSYRKLRELVRIGKARQHEWIPWANSTLKGIEQCREPMQQISRALAECWQELSERLGTMNISVTATNVGQQIATPADTTADVLEEFELKGLG